MGYVVVSSTKTTSRCYHPSSSVVERRKCRSLVSLPVCQVDFGWSDGQTPPKGSFVPYLPYTYTHAQIYILRLLLTVICMTW